MEPVTARRLRVVGRQRWVGRVSRVIVLVVASLVVVAVPTIPAAQAASLGITFLGTVPSPVVDGHAGLYGWGAATMNDGSVIIGDIWNGRVVHFAKDGTWLGVLFRTAGPYGLAVDPGDGAIYVASSACCTVERWVRGSGGAYARSGSITNSGFRYPSRVTVGDDGRVYIADMLLGKIFVYSRAGGFLFSFGSKGGAPGQLRQPRAMAFDASGRLFVVDAYNSRISVFTAGGSFLFTFGSGQFSGSNIRGLSIDRAHGWIYVVDMGADLVKKFDLSGQLLLSMGGSGGQNATQCCSTPVGKFSDGGREDTVDGNGNVWVGDMANFRAQVFSPSGTPLFAVPDPPEPPAPGGYNNPQGVAVDSAGNVIVSDSWNFRIQKLNASGQFLWQRGVRGRFSGYALNYPRGVNADPRDGSIVVADNFSSVIKKFSADGTFLWKVGGQGSGPGQVNHPSQAAVGSDGTIYVADSWNARITVFNQNGGYVRTITSGPGFTMKDPRGITVDPSNGDLYVADFTAKAVFHLRNNGAWVATIGRDGSLGATLAQPNQVAVDGAHVYVTDPTKVMIYDKASRAFLGAITGVRGPQGISSNGNGVVYVSERGDARVSKWRVA
jgi:DNA-binding beta-propeller fold protein YncE